MKGAQPPGAYRGNQIEREGEMGKGRGSEWRFPQSQLSVTFGSSTFADEAGAIDWTIGGEVRPWERPTRRSEGMDTTATSNKPRFPSTPSPIPPFPSNLYHQFWFSLPSHRSTSQRTIYNLISHHQDFEIEHRINHG